MNIGSHAGIFIAVTPPKSPRTILQPMVMKQHTTHVLQHACRPLRTGLLLRCHNPALHENWAQCSARFRILSQRYTTGCQMGRQHLQIQKPQQKFIHTSAKEPPKALINDLPRNLQELVVDFDGTAVRFPSFWLRDHCPCPECQHPQTKQRQLDTFKLDPDTKALEAESEPEGLQVIWSDANHTSIYPWSWLRQHTPATHLPSLYNPRGKWQHVSPASPEYPTSDYTSVMTTDQGLATFLSQIRTYGFAFVSNTPRDAASTEALTNRIAFTRQTHYGGFWEVMSEASPIDTAYTNLALPNHTDNTYFTEPCGLQMFHCLSHTASDGSGEGQGGESTFVDGFAAAAHLYKLNPEYYKMLSNVRVVSHASGDAKVGSILNNAIHSSGNPILTHLTPNTPVHPRNLSAVRWNNSDRHSSTQWPNHQSMTTWYAAARLWNEIIHSKEYEIVVKLRPGMPVIFDNWRVLHGRKAFEGKRRLCGAYIGMDDFLAKGRAVEARLKTEGGETM